MEVMGLANQEALNSKCSHLGTEHILLGLISQGSGIGARVLKDLGVEPQKVRHELEKLVKSEPEWTKTRSMLPTTLLARKAIDYAIEETAEFNDESIDTEHLLLGLLREKESLAYLLLMNLGLRPEEVREKIRTMGR